MTDEIAGIVAQNISGHPVAVVEDGGVWLSGMNANVGRHAARIVGALESCGYECSEPRDELGGLYIDVPAAQKTEVPIDA